MRRRSLTSVLAQHYAFEGMLVTQLHNDPTQVSVFDPGLRPCARTGKRGRTVTRFHSAAYGEIQMSSIDFITDFFSDGAFQYKHRTYCMIVLIAFCLSTRLITGFLLKHVNHQTR
jgi:hypothetical protein